MATPEQPCLACGRETRPGSRLFTGRRSVVDAESGANGPLCASCQRERGGTPSSPQRRLFGQYAVIEQLGFGPDEVRGGGRHAERAEPEGPARDG